MYFLFRRIGFCLVTLWAALTLNFLIPRLMPGDPINALIQGLGGSNSRAAVGQPSFGDFEHWNDKATDGLLTAYMAATDPAAKQAALNGLQKIMVEQVPLVPLFYNVDWAEYSTKKVTGRPSAADPYATGGPVSSTAAWVALHLVPVGK